LIDHNEWLQRNRVALFVEKKQIKIRKSDQHRLFDQPMMFEILVRIAKGRAPDRRIDIGGLFVYVRATPREWERINRSGDSLFEQTRGHS